MTDYDSSEEYYEDSPPVLQKRRWYLLVFWLLFIFVLAGVLSIFYITSEGYLGEMPTFEVLENPNTNLATEILSEKGKILGKIYINDNRTPISYDKLAPSLVQALISTEDERFFSHPGIDFIGTLRAVIFLGTRGGGSTISQQLARQLFVGVRSRNTFDAITQKIKEWVIAVQLERSYTKQEIITMYFNIYDFGYLADGIRSAARIYFDKEPQDLNVEESATLVGMFKNSSLYNPIRNPVGVTRRRNVVLSQMEKNDVFSIRARDSLSALPLDINFHPETHDQGTATYFREHVRGFMKKWIEKNPKPDGSKYNLYKDGLKVHTTINKDMQEYAEAALYQHMKQLQGHFTNQVNNRLIAIDSFPPYTGIDREDFERVKELSMRRSERWRHLRDELGKSDEEILASFHKEIPMRVFSWKGDIDTIMTPLDSLLYYKHFLRAGLVSIEPQSGHIKAWVGGINYKHFKYDQVVQGARQTGSTFKPFLYATAIDQVGLSPCDEFPDVLHCIEANKYGNPEPWCPHNSGNVFSGEMTSLRKGLAKSINTISATLMDKVGPKPIVKLLHNLGVSSHIPEVPSIALGTADVKLLEMVAAYSSFANKGVYISPSFITRIEDKNGTILYENTSEIRDVLSDKVSYSVLSLMKGVTNFGSGRRLKSQQGSPEKDSIYATLVTGYPYKFDNPIAGKTGTTQNQSDGWFMGIVPNLATGIWVGGEDRATHFKSLKYGQGATMALPIWGIYMRDCYKNISLGISKNDFERPPKLNFKFDCDDTPGSQGYNNKLKEDQISLEEIEDAKNQKEEEKEEMHELDF